MFETALKKDELVTAVEFTIPEKSAYIKIPNPASRYALVGVFLAKYKKETICAVTGAQPVVFRSKEIEKALTNNFDPNSLNDLNLKSNEMNADIHASAEYRASLVITAAQKAVINCK
jgi:carbon-monoxide dehydrogenase medium subunit